MGIILFVSKDVGGTNALLPISDLLRKDHQIQWIVQKDGRGKDILRNSGQDFVIYSPATQINKDKVVAVVSSMCSDVGQNIARSFKKFCPVITVQDQWNCGLYNVWVDSRCRPDYVLANDELDRIFVLRAWPDFEPDRIILTGYPALDKYAQLDVQAARTAARKRLSLPGDKPVVLFAGQWQNTGHAIAELVVVLNDLEADICLIARTHPAMRDNAPEEIPLWEKALSEFSSGTLIDSSFCSISEVIYASDLVLSMYSTTLIEVAVLRMPNIAILYPDYGLKEYRELAKSDEYPMVSLGCTAKAGNREELKKLIKTALYSDLCLRTAQEKVFNLDGKNAARATNFISNLLPSDC